MGTKNLIDNPSTTDRRPAVFNDLTGETVYEPRMDITATLLFLHETYATIAAAKPEVNMLAKHFAVSAICYHMGWLPAEIAIMEQYVSQTTSDVTQSMG